MKFKQIAIITGISGTAVSQITNSELIQILTLIVTVIIAIIGFLEDREE